MNKRKKILDILDIVGIIALVMYIVFVFAGGNSPIFLLLGVITATIALALYAIQLGIDICEDNSYLNVVIVGICIFNIIMCTAMFLK